MIFLLIGSLRCQRLEMQVVWLSCGTTPSWNWMKLPPQTNKFKQLSRNLLQMLGNTLVYHEGRTSNRAADRLAKEGTRMNNNQLFEEWTVTPLFIYRTIDIDKEETYFDGSLQTVLMNARNITSTACNIATNYNNSVPQSMTVAMYDAY
ncbi:uncharacterized protein LOC107862671 [Capsicum annuum]|uniref:uncharacterized protein LOC107862671 n=1 Tax=Capsicum annuum TaxID=4072 RepID=UPI001FB053B0|nr:uncharacterized protein LOC107862671 [Capsicum annuum]